MNKLYLIVITVILVINGAAADTLDAVKEFNLTVTPSTTINRGKNISISFEFIILTKGRISQNLRIHDPDNHSQVLKEISKPIGKSSGKYKSNFTFSFPKQIPA